MGWLARLLNGPEVDTDPAPAAHAKRAAPEPDPPTTEELIDRRDMSLCVTASTASEAILAALDAVPDATVLRVVIYADCPYWRQESRMRSSTTVPLTGPPQETHTRARVRAAEVVLSLAPHATQGYVELSCTAVAEGPSGKAETCRVGDVLVTWFGPLRKRGIGAPDDVSAVVAVDGG